MADICSQSCSTGTAVVQGLEVPEALEQDMKSTANYGTVKRKNCGRESQTWEASKDFSTRARSEIPMFRIRQFQCRLRPTGRAVVTHRFRGTSPIRLKGHLSRNSSQGAYLLGHHSAWACC
jgi:hypothetical protein